MHEDSPGLPVRDVGSRTLQFDARRTVVRATDLDEDQKRGP